MFLPKPDPERHCGSCGALMSRKRFNGRLEDMSVFLRRRYCGRECMARAYVKEEVTRKGHLVRARKFRKSACEICGGNEKLGIHHKDRDWANDAPDNLQTLCASCHTSLHHAAGEISPRLPLRNCRVCGRPDCNRSVCNTCRTRERAARLRLARRLGVLR
jgi:hypothetical protein